MKLTHVASLVLLSALALGACAKKPSAPSGAGPKGAAPGAEAPASSDSVLVISARTLVSVADSGQQGEADPGEAVFEQQLYPIVRANCTGGGCHDNNAWRFASDGVPLAYASVKAYLTADGTQSLMYKQIKGGHNGKDPAIADQLAPAITAVSAAKK